MENTKFNQLNWLSKQLRGTKVVQYGTVFVKTEANMSEDYVEWVSGCLFHYSKLVDLNTPPRIECHPPPFVNS